MTPPGDLFEAAASERLASRAPLAARLRPRSLDEVVGQQHLVGVGAPLRVLVETDRFASAILWGPPGTGKTTLARLLAERTAKAFVTLSATASGVKDVRESLEDARRRLGEQGTGTILFIDEVHRFNKAQQDVLLPGVEEGLVVLVGATTENPFFEVNPPLLSRATLWRLHPLSSADLSKLVVRGLEAEEATGEPDAIEALVTVSDGDARAALTTLEVAVALASVRAGGGSNGGGSATGGSATGGGATAASATGGGATAASATAASATGSGGPGGDRTGGHGVRGVVVTLADVSRARDGRLYHQGADEHYDQVSAFIKSLRGSDPDAGLYWLARMLDAGEDPRFLARRMVILASEDIGMADPQALVVAGAAAQALEFVGLPEAALNLAQAAVYLACAPKSNRVTVALGRARADLADGPQASVPHHLRDAHYRGASQLEHGASYRYPHDAPAGWVDQQYRPEAVEGHVYYDPSEHGREAAVAERLRRRGGI